ncbi:zinc finger protein 12-like [Battus philenor]|uniref:zinc finger protein 12-like n=1 Tax=Battus philenor TaxID=42288 RepID=UPI0035CF1FCF
MELENENILYYDLCRMCLTERGSNNIHEETNLKHDIFICTGIKVSISDNLPGKICQKCSDTIKKAIDFRHLVIKNDLRLKSLFGVIKEEETDSNDINNEDIVSTYFTNQNDTFPINESDKNEDCCVSEKQNCSVQPRLTVRKDLFENTTQDSFLDENNDQQKDDVKRVKKDDIEIIEYRCADCKKNFETWKKLYLHARLHKKTMVCPIGRCGKKFATKGDLEKHIRIHTGEKPYQCNLCDKSFAQRGSLKSHKETVHAGKT